MKYVHGLYINITTINKILEIAHSRNYLEKNDYNLIMNRCDKFEFNEIEDSFEFSILESDICIKLERNEFIKCYTEFLKL